MPEEVLSALFDDWSETFDDDVGHGAADFPFAGYDEILRAVAQEALGVGPLRVLDLGCGTGTLLATLHQMSGGIELWGIDCSARMLDRARGKVPTARLIQADFADDLARIGLPRFDAIVSTYVLHELPDERKLDLLAHLRERYLEPTGTIAVGDIAFACEADRDAVRARADGWDNAEHYLAADGFLDRLASLGVPVAYRQASFCAGVLTIPGAA